MKIVLTNYQANLIIEACEYAQNPDYGDSDPINRSFQHIIDKIEKAQKCASSPKTTAKSAEGLFMGNVVGT